MNRAELEALGFDFVPVVVLDGRAMIAFPEGPLRRELGIAALDQPEKRGRRRVLGTMRSLRLLLAIVPHISDDHWTVQLVTERYRPLGQWVWHIFRFVEEVMQAARDQAIHREQLLRMAERRYWTEEEKYRSFKQIAEYGLGVERSLGVWMREELPQVVTVEVLESPWGRLEMVDLLDQLDRHTASHLWQIIDKLRELDPSFEHLPTDEQMSRVPRYADLAAD